jgi:hypothetical protein
MKRCGGSPLVESALTLRDRIHRFLPSQFFGEDSPQLNTRGSCHGRRQSVGR